nr:methyltransferase domain-containing protein [Halovenus rubra]
MFVREDREYLLSPGERLESDLGILEVPEDVSPGDTVETHLGTAFRVRKLRGPDLFNHFERTGAPMMPRDLGLIIGHTGIAGGDHVLDAGTGTGVLSASMARAGATVTTYEVNSEFADVARENMELAGVRDSVDVRTGDVTEELTELRASESTDDTGKFDVVTLDTADAPTVVANASGLLVDGGFIAVYSPFIEDTRETVEAAREEELEDIRTFETIQRRMDFDDRGSRPSTAGVGHTGYLTFARKQ